MTVRWPLGPAALYASIYYRREILLNGTVLAIDPSSGSKTSQPGFAVFQAGAMTASGIIPIPHTEINTRLQTLYRKIRALLPVQPDILLIEQIGGKAHHALLEAIGASIVAADATTIRVHMALWKAWAKSKPDYVKNDVTDAIMIGESVLQVAREFQLGNHAVFPPEALGALGAKAAPRSNRKKLD